MKNELYYNPTVNPNIFNEIKKEKEFIGYYDLPLQDTTYLLRLDKFKQKDIVVIGIGGSSLGTKAVNTFLSYQKKEKKIHFIETTDPITIKQVLEKVNMKDSVFLVVSKSGTTIETIAVFKYILSFKNLNNKDFIFITDLDSPLYRLGEEYKIETFEIGKNIGGRFSILSLSLIHI
jgi:glucose-6-phosphate isomerase